MTLSKTKGCLWPVFTFLVFLVCCSIIYKAFLSEGSKCLFSSGCKQPIVVKTDKLIGNSCYASCNNPGCVKFAQEMLSKMNPNADPCEDFHSFACGKYLDSRSNFEIMQDNILIVLKDLIEKTDATHGSVIGKLKAVYQTCINPETSENTAIPSMLQFLDYIELKNWPNLSPDFQFASLERTLGRLFSFGEFVFIAVSSRDSEGITGNLNTFEVFMQEFTFHSESEIDILKDIVEEVLTKAGLKEGNTTEIWNDFLSIDTYILELMKNNSEAAGTCHEDYLVRCTTATESYEIFICKVIKSLVNYSRLSKQYSGDHLYVRCSSSHYVKNIFSLLNTYTKKSLANYIAFRVFIGNLKYASPRTLLRFKRKKEVVLKEMDRWKFCTFYTTELLQAMNELYITYALPSDFINDINSIFRDFMNAGMERLMDQDWIENEVKQNIYSEITKVGNNMNMFFNSRNKEDLENIYKRFRPTKRSFVTNVFKVKKFQFFLSKDMPSLSHLVHNPYEVGAVYDGDITLTFGITRPPVYSYEQPRLFNLAKLGQIIGHELGHLLTGHLDGIENNYTRSVYEAKKKCLVDHFSQYDFEHIKAKVDGKRTLNDNMADNVALTLTEKAVENILRKMKREQFSLPSLEYTPDQLFYISYAQMWCERSNEENEHYYARDIHSPPKYRILGPMKSSKRFFKVFNCSHRAQMNPPHKCSIYE